MCSRFLNDMKDEEVGKNNKVLINNWANMSRDFYEKDREKHDITITANTSKMIRGYTTASQFFVYHHVSDRDYGTVYIA